MNLAPGPDDPPRYTPDPATPRHRPRYDPRRVDPDEGDTAAYGVTHEPPPPRAEPVAEPEELEPEPGDDAPRPKRRKRRPPGMGVLDPKYRDKILDQPDDHGPDPMANVLFYGVAAAGALANLVAIAVVAYSAGRAAGFLAVVMAGCVLAASLVELAGITMLLFFTGEFFQIDYGPVRFALPRLAAVVLLVNGLILLAMLAASGHLALLSIALFVTAIIGFGSFQALFRLSFQELVISLAGLGLTAMATNTLLVMAVAHNTVPK